MAGIRVSHLSYKRTEREIKIYFTKPENGGGPLQTVYYPLFNNEAAIIFKDPKTSETVIGQSHVLMGEEICVTPLPFPQVFTEMDAKLDPSVAAFLQATEEVRDELQYNRNVAFCYDQNKSITGIRGNWYELELAWAYIEQITRQQNRTWKHQYPTTSRIQVETQRISQSPGEVSVPIISMPSLHNSLPSFNEKSTDVQQIRDSAKAEIKRNSGDLRTQTYPKMDKAGFESPVRSDGGRKSHLEEEDDDEDNVEKLAGLTLSGNKESVSAITILHDKPDDVRSLDFQYGCLTISVYSGMITMAETESIVNAAMGCMVNAGGVALAIANAAGPKMQRECDDYVRQYGSVPTTKVIHTSAGGQMSLHVKYVIHAVGPVWSASRERECSSQLTQTFLNCMKYGNDVLKIQSISMPVISSGIFGCPLELCVRSFFNAVLLFTNDRMSDDVHLKNVNLVNNNCDNTALTVLQLRQLIGRETKDLVIEAQQQIQHIKEVDYRVEDVVGRPLDLVYGTSSTSEGATARLRPTNTLLSDRTSPIASGVHGSSSSKSGIHTSSSSRTTSNASIGKITSSVSSMSIRASSSPSTAASASKKGGRSDTTSSSKTGPPTTSYLYSDRGIQTTSGVPITTGRPLPHPPPGAPRPNKKY